MQQTVGQLDLAPDPDAAMLADWMIDASNVQETILDETLDSAEANDLRESGRTACGADRRLHPPLRRFPEAVELAGCPVTHSQGVWHTHVSRAELQNPQHSLPDWANVVFAGVDASMVVGTQSAEVVTTAYNPNAMVAAFQNALGLEVESTADVVRAREDGRIPNPSKARERVRSALAPLVERVPTGFDTIDARLAALQGGIPARGIICDSISRTHQTTGGPLHDRAKACRDGLAPIAQQTTEGISIRQIAIGQVIGTIVGTLTAKLVFDGES